MTPVWLLDIDGVLNAVVGPGKPPTHAWPLEDWLDVRANSHNGRWRIMTSRSVCDFIRMVHENGLAEVRWHTTWQHHAQEVADVLKLPTFPVQEAPEYMQVEESLRRDQWWKLPAVWRVLAEGRRVVWTDDDSTYDLNSQQKATLKAAGALVIGPDPQTGLCKRHLRQIEQFLAEPLPSLTPVGADEEVD